MLKHRGQCGIVQIDDRRMARWFHRHEMLLPQNPGAIDQHIRNATAALARRRELLRCIWFGVLGRQSQHVIPVVGSKLLCQRFQLVGVTRDPHKVVARVCEAMG